MADPSPSRFVGVEVHGTVSPPQGKAAGAERAVAYRLERFVGAGKFAWVYEARTAAGERVAVKLLFRADVQAVRRFQREIKVMRQLPAHPNCVAYKGHGAEAGHAWVAMDFIDGFTLSAVLRSGKAIPEPAACKLMAQLCDGFEGLHKLGLTHRDITPDNIMITQADRQVKLMDFGLVQDSQGLLQLYEQVDIVDGEDFKDDLDAGLIAGTPEFMAPEQILDPHEKDRARQKTDTTADVFALGTIFYQLLAGKQLFPYEAGARGATGKQALINYLDYRVRLRDDAIVCPPTVEAPLWSIVRKSLARDPKLRQRDATELGADVSYYLETGEGVFEDDLSATIASEFDARAMKSLTVGMSTGEFKSLQKAASESQRRASRADMKAVVAPPAPASRPPSAAPPAVPKPAPVAIPAMAPKPARGAPSTLVDNTLAQSVPTEVDARLAPDADAIARAVEPDDEPISARPRRGLLFVLGALVFTTALLVAFFLSRR